MSNLHQPDQRAGERRIGDRRVIIVAVVPDRRTYNDRRRGDRRS